MQQQATTVEALREKKARKDRMKLSLPPKLLEKLLVWVPAISCFVETDYSCPPLEMNSICVVKHFQINKFSNFLLISIHGLHACLLENLIFRVGSLCYGGGFQFKHKVALQAIVMEQQPSYQF
jgi:hypothetical protein